MCSHLKDSIGNRHTYATMPNAQVSDSIVCFPGYCSSEGQSISGDIHLADPFAAPDELCACMLNPLNVVDSDDIMREIPKSHIRGFPSFEIRMLSLGATSESEYSFTR